MPPPAPVPPYSSPMAVDICLWCRIGSLKLQERLLRFTVHRDAPGISGMCLCKGKVRVSSLTETQRSNIANFQLSPQAAGGHMTFCPAASIGGTRSELLHLVTSVSSLGLGSHNLSSFSNIVSLFSSRPQSFHFGVSEASRISRLSRVLLEVIDFSKLLHLPVTVRKNDFEKASPSPSVISWCLYGTVKQTHCSLKSLMSNEA